DRKRLTKAAGTDSGTDAVPDRHERLIDIFLDALWAERGISPATAAAYRGDLAGFLASVRLPVQEMARADVLEFLARRMRSGAHTSSIIRQLSCLRQFF